MLIDAGLLREQSRQLAQRIADLERQATEIAGTDVQSRQPEADRRDPVRATEAAGAQEDRQRRAVDRRGSAGETGRGLSAAEAAAGAPRTVEAEVDLLRQAAGQRRCERPCAHELWPGDRGHRPAVVVGPQPAEHPDPHRGRQAHSRGVHCAARPLHRLGGLFADRAAHHGPHLRGRRACSTRFPRARTFIARPPPRSSARRSAKSRASSGATPRSSTSD